MTWLSRVKDAARSSRLGTALSLGALATALYVVIAPLTACRYVPLTDLPFHATTGATFLHYWNSSYHLREQFDLHPISVPYMLMYGLVAGLMAVFPMTLAIKITVAIHLFLVPAGLSVFFHGAKKSPLLGLLGLSICWNYLTEWGFLNYVAALGLFLMSMGITLMLVDRPTRKRQAALAIVLVLLLYTHVFRYPFAVAAVAGTALLLYPATKRLKPVVLPVLPSLALFVFWWFNRPFAKHGHIDIGFHPSRLWTDFGMPLVGGFTGTTVPVVSGIAIGACACVIAIGTVGAVIRWRRGEQRFTAWDIGVTVAPCAFALLSLVLFLVLPMSIFSWWYVYPREAVAVVLLLMAACPDLPDRPVHRAAMLIFVGLTAIVQGHVIATQFATAAPDCEAFYAITRRLPQAPKLLYLMVDLGGTTRDPTPFVHLPAYVQAEKGGWLSWHFALRSSSVITYRTDPGAVVPPKVPPRWEWSPDMYKPSMTPFFDWFLVRQKAPPDALFAHDPSIREIDHIGEWWLYCRAKSDGFCQ